MTFAARGSLRLFRLAGIDVFLQWWSWLIVAVIVLKFRTNQYSSQAWNIAEYLALFGIVLLHEFGHALACRQVGGTANKIVLWPLGGIAYVAPPPRPGAVLWSIAGGPLVNVALVPVTIGLWRAGLWFGWHDTLPDFDRFLLALVILNGFLLVSNMLPIYPLDGGQILQALLWFAVGRARSLFVASVIGLIGGVLVGGGLALLLQDGWIALIAGFIVWRSWAGIQQARALGILLSLPRHTEASCPSCEESPLQGEFWSCGLCKAQFDTFKQGAVCPGCGSQFLTTMCLFCKKGFPLADWYPPVVTAELAHEEPAATGRDGDDGAPLPGVSSWMPSSSPPSSTPLSPMTATFRPAPPSSNGAGARSTT